MGLIEFKREEERREWACDAVQWSTERNIDGGISLDQLTNCHAPLLVLYGGSGYAVGTAHFHAHSIQEEEELSLTQTKRNVVSYIT